MQDDRKVQDDKKYENSSHSFAFTLAEVLIAITIIGVIAAITLPPLINNIQDEQYKTGYKRAYSAISQAFEKASQEYEIVPLTGVWSSQGSDANFLTLKKQFIVSKECQATSADMPNCWNTSGEVWRGEQSNSHSFIDNSGMAWRTRVTDGTLAAPAILVDINGYKKPNQYGKDRFVFLFTNQQNKLGWSNNIMNDMGIPTKLIPLEDITATDATALTFCPSAATHPCYYTTWLK